MLDPTSESYTVEDLESLEFSAAPIQQRQQENEEVEPMSIDDDSASQQREDSEDFEQAETPPPQDEVKQPKKFRFSTKEFLQTEPEPKQEEQQEKEKPSPPARPPDQIQKVPPQAKTSTVLVGIISHNNEASIGKTLALVGDLGGKVVVCDDGSTDTSEEIARRMGAEVVRHPRPLGRSDSITSLFLAARREKVDILLTVAADSKFTTKDLETLLGEVKEDKCDIAIGSNALSQQTKENDLNRLFNNPIKDKGSIIRAYGKRAIEMVAPIDLRQVVLIEEKILEAAEQQSLRITDFPLSVQDSSAYGKQTTTSKHKKTGKRQPFILKMINLVILERPLLIFSSIALVFLAAAVFQSALALYVLVTTAGYVSEFGVLLDVSMFALYAIFAIAAAVLHSQKVSREEAKNQRVP